MKTPTHLAVLLFVFLSFNCQSNSKKTKQPTKATKQTETKPVKSTNTNSVKYIYGIDISHYQGDEADLMTRSRNNDSIQFIICKATQGKAYIDPDFKTNWETISKNGFIKGAYHFYISTDDPEAQASNFLNTIKSLKKTNIPPIVDFEEGGIDTSQSIDSIQINLLRFLNIVETRTNRKPMIYTDDNVGNTYLSLPEFANYPLWIANYTNVSAPVLPEAWQNKGWNFWQKSDTYDINNIENDFDVFNGNLKDLKEFIKNN
ncbi:GH25 family lysozyme [Pontimicrobium sp. MEBiC06410]